jgi:hypothetical protein
VGLRFLRASVARNPNELPRKISTQAKVSIVRVKPVSLSERGELSFIDPEDAIEHSGLPLPDQLLNRLVRSPRVE